MLPRRARVCMATALPSPRPVPTTPRATLQTRPRCDEEHVSPWPRRWFSALHRAPPAASARTHGAKLGRRAAERCGVLRPHAERCAMSDVVSRLKSELAAVIAQRIAGWRRADIAVGLGAALSSVSRLRTASVDRFTLDALVRYAHRLGYDVELRLHYVQRGSEARRRRGSRAADGARSGASLSGAGRQRREGGHVGKAAQEGRGRSEVKAVAKLPRAFRGSFGHGSPRYGHAVTALPSRAVVPPRTCPERRA